MLFIKVETISNIFDSKFGKIYYPLICIFTFLLGYYYLYYLHHFIYSYNEWLVADWLINYSGGFVRRGLSGEILLAFSDFFSINILNLLFIFLSVSILTLLLLILIFLSTKNLTFWLFLIFASPAFLAFYFYDPSIIGRKEILIYLSYFGWLIYIDKTKKLQLIPCIIFSIIGSLITLFHEVFFFYSIVFYLITILYFDTKPFSLNYSLMIPISSFLVALLFVITPTEFDAGLICSKILEFNIHQSVCENGILKWPASGLVESIRFNYSIYNFWTPLGIILILILPIIPFLLIIFSSQVLKNLSYNQLIFFLLTQFLFMIPLFLIANDWGRWINIQSILLGLSTIILLDKKTYKLPSYIDYSPNEKILGFTIPILLLLFMSSWNLRHCCKDGNFLIEINGLIGSIYSIIF